MTGGTQGCVNATNSADGRARIEYVMWYSRGFVCVWGGGGGRVVVVACVGVVVGVVVVTGFPSPQ
jgi:hypothetical protein